MHIPRIIISAVRGGAGKTLLSLGLCRALQQAHMPVKPYKKGPDYIDAYWLQQAACCSCTNLDPYFLDTETLLSLFAHSWTKACASLSSQKTLALIEGNRGLFDGQDIQGSHSTATLARLMTAPVILSLDITKMTRTAAAVIHGMATFEDNIHIGGVVLNQVGSPRHESIVRASIEQYTDIPVLGALPRLKHNPLPERHMGLVSMPHTSNNTTTTPDNTAHAILDTLGKFITEHVDTARIVALAQSAPHISVSYPPNTSLTTDIRTDTHTNTTHSLPTPPTLAHTAAIAPFWHTNSQSPKVRIGYVYDAALWFYYAENLEALTHAGAQLVPLSLLDPTPWPSDIHALYLGGGFPEEFSEMLSASPHMRTLQTYSETLMPIYAECGGFMVLAEALSREKKTWPMAGIFPVQTNFYPKPQGLGYVRGTIYKSNPFHPVGAILRAHEFHYSRCHATQAIDSMCCIRLEKGIGMGACTAQANTTIDGLCIRNTFASYTHIFAPACPWWAINFVNAAQKWKHTV